MLYEGTNGSQAMDLCGRKLGMNGGATVQAFFAMIDDDIAAAKGNPELADIAGRLEKALGEQKAATMWFMQKAMANPDNLGAGAHNYMHIMGTVMLGFISLRMATVAPAKLAQAGGDAHAFYRPTLTSSAP